MLPTIINIIYEYFASRNENEHAGDGTLLIDFQQWIISILKTSEQRSQDDINSVFICLGDSRCKWSMPVRKLLFDELIDLSSIQFQPNISSIVDRIEYLLPIIMQCISDRSRLQYYQIPYHPSVFQQHHGNRLVLLDLFFFHIDRHVNESIINEKLINELIALKPPKIRDQELVSSIKMIYKQLKEYFLLRSAALYLCQTTLIDDDDSNGFLECLKVLINGYLSINETTVQLTPNLQIFLSTIISKRSWRFLLDLLQSNQIQSINQTWANILYHHLELKQVPKSNKYLQFSHQLQFTLSTNSHALSIFPHLHQPYEELTQIIISCINNETGDRWKPLSDWIQLKLNTVPVDLQMNDIKVILLLNIYYNYYCNNQLQLLNTLLNVIERTLDPSSEELRVFRSLLEPERYMIGYPQQNNNPDFNYLNNLFKLDCEAADELCIRHSLVNLMAMIIKGGVNSFLWTFAFDPLSIESTFGFGSTRESTVQRFSVHYDCGCIITENGELVQYTNNDQSSQLNVPAIYAVYFSTFGAMAWHLLLFNKSVDNLNGPILSPSAIADTTPTGQMGGNSLRAKVCHFVRARLFSVFNFLAIRSNQDDACILLNCCFERMAYLTVHQRNSWIKPVYRDFNSKLSAEKSYQNEVFYHIHQQLAEYKAYVDRLQLQSQIQFDLQQYTSQMPVTVQTTHFKTEMYNPKNAHLSLRVLQQFIDSTEFLSKTKHIYELSRFYLLLHQTYAQLIEREKVWDITLKELHDRAKEHLSNYTYSHRRNEAKDHMDIIMKGIEAVNAYHSFTNGLIRPGPCDETQRFTEISLSTPVHCLIANENPDEGDIIMRILSILVDYHNNFLDLIEQEFDSDTINNNSNTILRFLIKKLLPNRISIIQIAHYNTGVITLSDIDCSWIEKISAASLILGKEYFLKLDTPFNFDFAYVQSYIIRTYLLLCHINYQHIAQKYQFYEPRKIVRVTTLNDDDESFDLNENYSVPLEYEWNHLNDMLIDKLYHGYNLLKQIATRIKEEQNDLSSLNIYEFIASIPENNSVMQRLIQYDVRDFKLCHLNHIGKLYRALIRTFEYSFVNIPDLLRTPIDADLSNKLQQIFETKLINISYDDNIDVLQAHIHQINQLLYDLKSIEDILLHQSAKSLRSISEDMGINNDILILIPEEIKCENYISLSIYLNQIQSILQERKINIEEKTAHLWKENFDSNRNEQDIIGENRYHRHLHGNDITDSTYSINISNEDESDSEDEPDSPKYSSLFQLHINAVPIASCKLISERNHQQSQKIEPMKKVQSFVITHPDGKSESNIWKNDKLYEELKQLFNKKKYDLNTYDLVDNNKILFDFTGNNNHPPSPLPLEYFVVEKAKLISSQFLLGTQQFDYSTMPDCTLSSLMDRLINDQNLKLTSSNHRYCFYDEIGRYIDGGNIGDLHGILPVVIRIQEQDDNTILYEVTLTSNQGEKKAAAFLPIVEWKQIEIWRKLVLPEIESPCVFWDRDNKTIVDGDQSLASLEKETATLDGIALDQTIQVILSFGTDIQHISILKSATIEHLLNNQHVSNLNLNNCCLTLDDNNDQILSKDDYRKQVGAYRGDVTETIHFRILIPINIQKNDDKQVMKIFLKNNTTTVEQLLQQIDISDNGNLYLTSNDTQRIFQKNENVTNLNMQNFILVEENETCVVSIENATNQSMIDRNDVVHQRFRISATIGDIMKENNIDYCNQQLLHDKDFVPSENTPLSCFTSPIYFQLIDTNLLSVVAIINTEDNSYSLTFYCSPSMSTERILEIACQLFRIRKVYYCLHYGQSKMGEGILLEDLDAVDNKFEFQLISTATIKCSISYTNQTMIVPCSEETQVSEIVKYTLESLHIGDEEIDSYELFSIHSDNKSGVGSNLTIEDLVQMWYDETRPAEVLTLKFELEKKND